MRGAVPGAAALVGRDDRAARRGEPGQARAASPCPTRRPGPPCSARTTLLGGAPVAVDDRLDVAHPAREPLQVGGHPRGAVVAREVPFLADGRDRPGAHRRVVGEAQAGRRPRADVADDPDGHVDLGEPVVGHAVPQQVGARAPADLERDRPATRRHGQRQHLALDRLQRDRVVDASAVVVGPPVVDPQHDQPGPRVGGQHAAGEERGDGAVDEVEAHGAVVAGEGHGPGVERGAAAQPAGVLADPFQPRLVVEDAPDGGAVGGVPAERERGAAGRGDEPEPRGADRSAAVAGSVPAARRTRSWPSSVGRANRAARRASGRSWVAPRAVDSSCGRGGPVKSQTSARSAARQAASAPSAEKRVRKREDPCISRGWRPARRTHHRRGVRRDRSGWQGNLASGNPVR